MKDLLLSVGGVGPIYSIYYSSAFSQYSCYQDPLLPFPTNFCGINNYRYFLNECDPASGSCTSSVKCIHSDATINPPNGVCQVHGPPEPACDVLPCDLARYSCSIVDGPNPPTEDAFIEWFWAVQYTAVFGQDFITGKFTFCANSTYIYNTWRANLVATGNGYLNTVGYGIPMFNPSNHNV